MSCALLTSASLLLCTFAVRAEEVDRTTFDRTVKPFLTKYCADCHSAVDPEAGLDLTKIDPDLLTGDDFETWRIVEERTHFSEMPPKESDQPSQTERKAVLGWITAELRKTMQPGSPTHVKLALPQFGNYVDHDALFGERRSHVTPAPPRLWRLRPDIYEALSRRVARGEVQGLANGLDLTDAPEFRDYSAPYFLDEASTAQLVDNARRIVRRQLTEHGFKDLVATEEPPSDELLRRKLDDAFRVAIGRGVTDEERARFLSLYERATTQAGHRVGLETLLSAVLLQPEFVFRQEVGVGEPDEYGRVALAPRELAFALSYALDDEPVEEFFTLARDGKLNTQEQIRAAVRDRLVDESIGRDKNPRIRQFFREYFDYPRANEIFKDNPAGGTHESRILVNDLDLMIREILRADRDVLKELLSSRDYYVNVKWEHDKRANGPLMQLGHESAWPVHASYSLPLDWKWLPERQPVRFRTDERAGVLTHPAWLAAWSGNFDNHPVQRGKWVRTHLLGGTVPDVPIGVDARVPEREHASFRTRLEETTRAQECWRCHRKMDPLGLPFEQFDHYGRVQRLDNGEPVRTSGAVTLTRDASLDQQVEGPTEMLDHLARSERVEQVFIRHAFRYFLGRNETLGDANTLQDAHRAYVDSGGSFEAVIVSLLSSDSFRLRQLPQEE